MQLSQTMLSKVQKEVKGAAHRVVVTVLTDEWNAAIAWNISAAFTHQVPKGL